MREATRFGAIAPQVHRPHTPEFRRLDTRAEASEDPLAADGPPETMLLAPDGCGMRVDPVAVGRLEMSRWPRFRPGAAIN